MKEHIFFAWLFVDKYFTFGAEIGIYPYIYLYLQIAFLKFELGLDMMYCITGLKINYGNSSK